MRFRRCTSAGVRFLSRGLWRWVVLAAAVAVVSGTGFQPTALGRPRPRSKAKKSPRRKATRPAPAPKLEEDLVLQTHDGLQLALTYYRRRRQRSAPTGTRQEDHPHCVVARVETEPERLQGSRPRSAEGRLRGDRAGPARARRKHPAERRRPRRHARRREDAAQPVQPDGHAGHEGGQGFPVGKEQRRRAEYRQAVRRGGRDGGVRGLEFRHARRRRTKIAIKCFVPTTSSAASSKCWC